MNTEPNYVAPWVRVDNFVPWPETCHHVTCLACGATVLPHQAARRQVNGLMIAVCFLCDEGSPAYLSVAHPERICPCCTNKDVAVDCSCPAWCPEQTDPKPITFPEPTTLKEALRALPTATLVALIRKQARKPK